LGETTVTAGIEDVDSCLDPRGGRGGEMRREVEGTACREEIHLMTGDDRTGSRQVGQWVTTTSTVTEGGFRVEPKGKREGSHLGRPQR